MAKKVTEEMMEKAKQRREKFAQLTKRLPESEDEREAVAVDLFIQNVEGHELSAANKILLTYQRENITIVGGFQQWRKAGRHVRKGESALCIWVPAKKKEGENKAPSENGKAEMFFFLGSVWDVTQTDPNDGPEVNVSEMSPEMVEE